MTEFNKYKIKRHWNKFGIVYSMAITMLIFMVAIGLEAQVIN